MAVKFLNGIDVDGSMNIAASDVPNLDASKITSGTFSADRIPTGLYQPAGDYLDLETANTTFQPLGNYLTSVPSEYLTQTEGDARYVQSIPTPSAGAWWNNGYIRVLSDGVMEVGKYLDFHTSNTGTSDFDVRVTAGSGTLTVGGVLYATGGNSGQWNTAYGWGNHASAGYLTSIPSTYATDAEVSTAVGAVDARIDNEVFPAINDLGNAIPTNNNQLTNGAGYLTAVPSSFTTTNITATGYIKGGGQQLVLSAGEAQNYATGQTAEYIYMNAEQGLEINSDTGNWAGGWAARKTAYLRGDQLTLDGETLTKTNIQNFKTAYGWGNHASAGYLTSIPSTYATDAEVNTAVGAVDTRINDEVMPYIASVETIANNKLDATAKAADSNLLDGIDSSAFLRSNANDSASGNITFSGTITHTGNLVVQGTSPTMSFLDTNAEHDFYIHVNSNNFYVLRNTNTAENLVGTGWDSPHPMQIESDTNSVYFFGNKLNSAAYAATTAFDSAGSAAAVSTALNGRIDTEVFGAIGDVAGTIPTNNNQLTNGAGYATTSYVNTAVSNLVASAPAALDTLNELAAALGDDANFSTTVANNIGAIANDVTAVNERIDTEVLPAIDTKQNAGNYATFANNIYLSNSTTTENFITELTNLGAFQDNYKAFKVAWSYAGNSDLNVGFETIELAGCLIECWGGTYKHVRVTRPTTGTGGRSIYVYNDQGSSYAPGWRQIWTSDEFSNTNLSNWNTAYGWGDHSAAGYLTSLPSHNHDTLYDSLGSANAVATALNERIDTEVFDAIGNVAGSIPTNNNQLTNGAGYLTSLPAHNHDSSYDPIGSADAVALQVNTRIDQEVIPSIPTNNNQLTNGAGYITAVPSAINVTSVGYGSGVTLSESSDRADLLYINSSTTGWGGLQIGNASNEFIFSLMGDGSVGGIYDDQNSDWIIQWTENAGVRLYHNAGEKLTTTSTGVSITGALVASGDVTAFSDARVKENVETLSNALDSVKRMRGVTYNKIGEEKQSVGVIAQELEEVVPQLVHTDEEGMKSVAYGNITAVLIEALKEQQAQIEELKARLDGLTK